MLTLTIAAHAIAFAAALYVRRRLHRLDCDQLTCGPNLELRDKVHAALYAKMQRAGRAK